MRFTKLLTLLIAIAMTVLLSANDSRALTLTLPDINFDTVGAGGLNYNASTGLLSVSARLNAVTMPGPVTTFPGGTVQYAMQLTGVTTVGSYTTGQFGTAPWSPDLLIVDGSNTTLLAGDFISAYITGRNGTNLGFGEAVFNVTGGTLAPYFICGPMPGCGGMVNLAFNLSANFSSTMFLRNFSGQSKGDIARVPEPSTLILLGSAMLGAGFWLRKRTTR